MSKKLLIFNPSSLSLNSKSFELQYFISDDLESIAVIEKRSHPFPWKHQNFQTSLDPHHCIGLRHNNEWVAYAVLSFVVGEAELLLFVVDKPWQGKGLASFFLREIIKASSQRAQSMFLEVRQSNQSAIYLYDAVGFNEAGLRPNYYPASSGKREDAVLMVLDI